jgi:hypothetical protein
VSERPRDDDELRRLRDDAPAPREDFVAAVMRQLATRPLPRRSWWRRLTAERELTVRVRPLRLATTVCALAALLLVVRPKAPPPATVRPTASDRDDTPVRVRFTLAAPLARSVALAGDFNGWRPDASLLQRRGDGSWSIEVPLGPGNWSYSFVVDGKWVEDPAAERWRDDGFGGRNAVVRVGDLPAAVGKARGG